jgi:hypothetical protein
LLNFLINRNGGAGLDRDRDPVRHLLVDTAGVFFPPKK